MLIDQSLEDIGNAQYLRKTGNKKQLKEEAHASKYDIITHTKIEQKMDHPGIHWVLAKLFLRFNLKPQIRVIVSSYTLSLQRKKLTFSIKEEGKLSKVLSCQVPIYTDLFPPPKVSDDYGFWKTKDHFFFQYTLNLRKSSSKNSS